MTLELNIISYEISPCYDLRELKNLEINISEELIITRIPTG